MSRRPLLNLTPWSRVRVRVRVRSSAPTDPGRSLDQFARRAAGEARAAEMAALYVGIGDVCYRAHFDPARYQFIQIAPGPAASLFGTDQFRAVPEVFPVNDEDVGVVLCTGAMETTAAPRYLLTEMNRVLAPKGHLYVATPLIVPKQADRPGGRSAHGHRPPRYGLNYLLEASGFTIEDVQPMPATPTYAVIARKTRQPG